MTQELDKCKHCGGQAKSSSCIFGRFVECVSCGIRTAFTTDNVGDPDVAAWNRRAEPEEGEITAEWLEGMGFKLTWATGKTCKYQLTDCVSLWKSNSVDDYELRFSTDEANGKWRVRSRSQLAALVQCLGKGE